MTRGRPAAREAQYIRLAPIQLPMTAEITIPVRVIELLPAMTRRTAGGMMTSLGIGTTELSNAIRKMRYGYPPVCSDCW